MDTLVLLKRVQSGELSPEEALIRLKAQPFEDLGYAKIDHHRVIRQGAGEVIYGAGKTSEQIIGIAQRLIADGRRNILITRLTPEKAEAVCAEVDAAYDPVSRIAIAAPQEQERRGGIVVATGGTS
ncbi:MAG: 1-(5-phosphoribosyl)-5-amino-4-imidazole-carboxylate carboxylase, partial [Eubacteriales bacterium]|nr:1-(5-phosphoribosyl)-5-amino-4-imidazole-carboxylate carboxylase [Eubacteriales bacterium]